jgi:nicotinate-nucleotide adenylyltransferase
LATVAIFGGSFNPPHVAHVLAVAWVLATQDVERVVVVPTYRHPFAKALAPYEDRLRMCELALRDCWDASSASPPRVEVSRVEEALGGESRTLRTLEHFREAHPDWSMRLVMGADLLLEADKWYRFDRIQELAPPLVLGRVGFRALGAPTAVLPPVSSTEVRAKIAAGDWNALEALVPRSVLAYVKARHIYSA